MMKQTSGKESAVQFSDEEADFLGENSLGRIATVSSLEMQPHVVPITFEFDGRYFYFGGWNLKNTLKFRNLTQNNKVALVVDDLVSRNPWHPRGLEIRGIAEAVEKEDEGLYVKITPLKKTSWGIVGNYAKSSSREK